MACKTSNLTWLQILVLVNGTYYNKKVLYTKINFQKISGSYINECKISKKENAVLCAQWYSKIFS